MQRHGIFFLRCMPVQRLCTHDRQNAHNCSVPPPIVAFQQGLCLNRVRAASKTNSERSENRCRTLIARLALAALASSNENKRQIFQGFDEWVFVLQAKLCHCTIICLGNECQHEYAPAITHYAIFQLADSGGGSLLNTAVRVVSQREEM